MVSDQVVLPILPAGLVKVAIVARLDEARRIYAAVGRWPAVSVGRAGGSLPGGAGVTRRDISRATAAGNPLKMGPGDDKLALGPAARLYNEYPR